MDSFYPILMFFGALFSFMIALGQLFQRKKGLISYIYAFSFLTLGLWIFQISLYANRMCADYFYIVLILIPFSFLAAPLMALRYVWVIARKFRARKKYLLLFIPFVFSIVILILPVFIPGLTLKKEFLTARPVFSESFYTLPLYFKIVHLLFVTPKIYLVTAMIPNLVNMSFIWKKKKFRSSMTVSRIGFVFSVMIMLSTSLTAIGDLVSIQMIKWSILYVNATLCSVFLATQRHPDFNRLLKIETEKAHYENSKIKSLDLDNLTEKLGIIMEEEKAFADEELTLNNLAAELEISPHQLSQFLNEKMKKNFNLFINEYRINEAKIMLLEEPKRSITSIAIAVGFNSNSTFSTVFSKHTGLSPKNFRKKSSGKTIEH